MYCILGLVECLRHCNHVEMIHLNLIFVRAENYMNAIVWFAYFMGCNFGGWKKLYGLNWVGWNKYMGWNMHTEKIIRAKIFVLKKYMGSIVWGEKNCNGWKNGPNKKQKWNNGLGNIIPKNLVAHEEAACYVAFSMPRLILWCFFPAMIAFDPCGICPCGKA